MMLSRRSFRHSRTVIDPWPTITSTWHGTSSIPRYGAATGSVLDDEIGEEDIGNLCGFHDLVSVFSDGFFQLGLAVGCAELFRGLLGQLLEDVGTQAHQLHFALLNLLGFLEAVDDQSNVDAQKPVSAWI